MPEIRFVAMPTDIAESYWKRMPDANGQPPERHVSDGSGNPCRHCLEDIAEGEAFLILAWRPFPAAQPYAETGPIFLHAKPCKRYEETAVMPAMFARRKQFLLRGYGEDDRIVYGTGQVVPANALERSAATLLQREEITYLHLRSGSYNCYQCRIERAPAE